MPDSTESMATLIPAEAEVEEVSFGTDRVTVTFTHDDDDGRPVRITVESMAPPHPDLIVAREAIVPVLLALVEITPRASNPAVVNAVSFKRSGDGARGAVVKGQRSYAESLGVLPINSPVKYSDDPQPQRRFTPDDWHKIEHLGREALLYVNGKSAQLALDLSVNGDGQAGTAPEAPDTEGAPAPRKRGRPSKADRELEAAIESGRRRVEGEPAEG